MLYYLCGGSVFISSYYSIRDITSYYSDTPSWHEGGYKVEIGDLDNFKSNAGYSDSKYAYCIYNEFLIGPMNESGTWIEPCIYFHDKDKLEELHNLCALMGGSEYFDVHKPISKFYCDCVLLLTEL